MPLPLMLLIGESSAAKAEMVTIDHEVEKGDTLSSISKRYGVQIDDILGWNESLQKQMEEMAKSVDPGTIEKAAFSLKVGMVLKIPGKPSGNKKMVSYKVVKGDSLWSIGKKFHVKPAIIVKWNTDELGVVAADEPGPATASMDVDSVSLIPGTILSVPGKPSGSDSKFIKHKVTKGETLWSIGKKYHVKPQVVAKWNAAKLGLAKPVKPKGKAAKKKSASAEQDGLPVLVPGMKLVIHADRPDLGERVAALRVKKGNTPKQVANLYGVDLDDLLAYNFLLAKDKLDVGDLVEVPLPVTKNDTRSVGTPNAGKLVAGEQMPPGPGYIVRNPALAYATSETITSIIKCVAHVQRRFSGTHDMVVGHLSKKGGGKLFPHKSHQSGRDVDLSYYHASIEPEKFFVATQDNLDVTRTASFVQCLVDSGQVKYIFIDTYIQKILYKHFDKKGATAEFLTTVFQYPAEEGKQLGIIRHEKGHDDHMHVRFACMPDDPACSE